MPNHLGKETSPYLLQHANNPVDWYPWGQEPLTRAQYEDKPIFLSIGYSACHWCHVMERESFSDPEIASLLNEHFINVKVDREERPDLDTIYMEAVTALTGHGGWPLSVWLTPAGVPFYGGTYFPSNPRLGMPSFRQVLEGLLRVWSGHRDDLEHTASEVLEHLRIERCVSGREGRPVQSAETTISSALRVVDATFDHINGGWGSAPKFPQPLVLEALMMRQTLYPNPELKNKTMLTLDAMAAGGIYDHLGGGFHRYATDTMWLVPHFEKMLYDNAQLARCYLHAWQLTGKTRYRTVAEETLDYLLREMRHTGGGFFSAQDADSEGREGKFFLWTPEDLQQILTSDEADLFARAYGVTAQGDFEGANILHLTDEHKEDVLLVTARAKLLAARHRRPHPALDDKILAGWNGLALAALADAGRSLSSRKYILAAELTAEFLLQELLRPGYRLCHSWKNGNGSGNGFLEDYAYVIEGLLSLYQATFTERWFMAAQDLLESMVLHFRRAAGGFYDTSSDHETLIVRPRSLDDSPTPSGNSMAVLILLKLAALTGIDEHRSLAEQTIAPISPFLARAPLGFGHWLSVIQLMDVGFTEVAIVGDMRRSDTQALMDVINETYRPTLVLASAPSGKDSRVALLAGREPRPDGGPEVSVCRRSTCSAPTSNPVELRTLLANSTR